MLEMPDVDPSDAFVDTLICPVSFSFPQAGMSGSNSWGNAVAGSIPDIARYLVRIEEWSAPPDAVCHRRLTEQNLTRDARHGHETC